MIKMPADVAERLRQHVSVMTAAYWAGVEDERVRIRAQLESLAVLMDDDSYRLTLTVVDGTHEDPSVAV